MAKYTVELGEMVSAHARLTPSTTLLDELTITGRDGEKMTYPDKFFHVYEPNDVIDNYAKSFFDAHVSGATLRENITSDSDLNEAIYNNFCQTFISHFWSYEIGQENPMNFLVALRAFCQEQLPLWYQSYQQLFINHNQWVTNTGDSLTTSKSNADSKTGQSSIAGQADTPQNELNFKLNTGDPAQDYNFNYSSNVNGAKSTGTGSQNTTGSSETKNSGRNQTIMSLISEMMVYADGIYFDLFSKAKQAGLFMLVMD